MKHLIVLVAVFGLVPSVRAQTQAMSRLVTVYRTADETPTPAFSRLVTVYLTADEVGTPVFSRLWTAYITPDVTSTRATSRMVTAYLNFTMPDAIACLRIAGGLTDPTARQMEIYDLITAGADNNVVSILDAYQVTRDAAQPGTLP